MQSKIIVGTERGIVSRKNDGLWLMVVCSPPFWKLLQDGLARLQRARATIPIWSARQSQGALKSHCGLPSSSSAICPKARLFARGGDSSRREQHQDHIRDDSQVLLTCISLQHPLRHGLGKIAGPLACLSEQPLGSRSRADPLDPDWSSCSSKAYA